MTQNTNLNAVLREALLADSKTEHGTFFEYISVFALTRGLSFGPNIASIERWAMWVNREMPHLTGRLKTDLGVDQIITTVNGEIWAVQNKGVADDTAGSYNHFTNFAAQAKLAHATRLFWVTSGTGLNRTAAEYVAASPELDVTVLNRQWLAEETSYPKTIADIRREVDGVKPTPDDLPHILRLDQRIAVEHIQASLEQNTSVQYISACGTGKTVVTHALHAERDSQLTAFFVPTLGLMKQTIRAWKRQAKDMPFTVIAVCSDQTVVSRKKALKEDHWEVSANDLGESLVRDSATLATKVAAATRNGRPVVLFVTYHSAHIVVGAQHLYGLRDIDLVIADEAHYLAGTSEFGEEVKDKPDARNRLRAGRRVYTTATPKVVPKKDRNRGLDSMDVDSPVFGPRAFTLNTGEAIQLGILSSFRLTLVAVPDTIVDDIRDGKTVGTGQGLIEARELAAVHAVGTAMATGNEDLWVSYHSSIKGAKRFAQLAKDEGIASFAEPIWGLQSARKRDNLVQAFQKSKGPALLTNVRCLIEGVDMPRLSGIILVNHKSDQGATTQAASRCLRLHPDKKVPARIILPIPIPSSALRDGLSAAEIRKIIREDGRWKKVYEVIDALGAHDADIDQVIEVMVGKWRDSSGNVSDTDERWTLPAGEAGSHFRERLISGLVLSVQRQVEGTFLRRFEAVKLWLETHGRLPETGKAVGDEERATAAFFADEMKAFLHGKQSEVRTAYLVQLPFWAERLAAIAWREQAKKAAVFFKHSKSLPSMRSSKTDEHELAKWLDEARRAHADGTLPAEHQEILDKIDVGWLDTQLSPWQQQATDVGRYIAEHGAAPSLTSTAPAERASAMWLKLHQMARSTGMLSTTELTYLENVAPGWQDAAVKPQV